MVADVVFTLPWTTDTVVVPAGIKVIPPVTSQSPAVSEMLAMFTGTPAVGMETFVPVAVTYSPTLPAFALLLVVVPTMPAVWDGVIVLVNVVAPLKVGVPVKVPDNAAPESVGVVREGDVENTADPVPVSSDRTAASCAEVVAANCDRLLLVSANVVPQESPVPLVYFSALFAVLQLGTAFPMGAAVLPEKFAYTLSAEIGETLDATIVAHPGAVDGPVEIIACPAVEPAGLSSDTGDSVAAVAIEARSPAAKKVRIFRM